MVNDKKKTLILLKVLSIVAICDTVKLLLFMGY